MIRITSRWIVCKPGRVSAIATGRQVEILYLADSPRVLLKDTASGKYI